MAAQLMKKYEYPGTYPAWSNLEFINGVWYCSYVQTKDAVVGSCIVCSV